MNKRKKIVFILGSMKRGGAERVISILSGEYARMGWDISVVLLLFPGVEYELDRSTKVIDFTGNAQSRIKRLPYWFRNIRRYIKKEKPDVVISFAARINVLTLAALLGIRTRKIISERNDPASDGRGFVTRAGTKILYPCADQIVFQTKRSLQYFSEKIVNKGVIIRNPISVTEYALPTEQRRMKIVSVGRLEPQKNHKMLIEAFVKIADKFPDYSLWIYGDGNLRGELEGLIAHYKLSDRIFLPGNVIDIHHQIADAEIFVLSSDYEGLSNALLEAMMMGLACISTRCAGSDEVITDGENGLLVNVGSASEMKDAIETLIKDTKLREKVGINARLAGEQYKTANILNEWNKILSR